MGSVIKYRKDNRDYDLCRIYDKVPVIGTYDKLLCIHDDNKDKYVQLFERKNSKSPSFVHIDGKNYDPYNKRFCDVSEVSKVVIEITMHDYIMQEYPFDVKRGASFSRNSSTSGTYTTKSGRDFTGRVEYSLYNIFGDIIPSYNAPGSSVKGHLQIQGTHSFHISGSYQLRCSTSFDPNPYKPECDLNHTYGWFDQTEPVYGTVSKKFNICRENNWSFDINDDKKYINSSCRYNINIEKVHIDGISIPYEVRFGMFRYYDTIWY